MSNELYDKATKQWGWRAQFIKALEELGELSVEVAKLLNAEVIDEHTESLVDEVADVTIMVEQITRIMRIGSQVDARKVFKLDRLAGILNEGA